MAKNIFLFSLISLAIFALACASTEVIPRSQPGEAPSSKESAVVGQSQPKWQVKWEKTLQDARREGRIIIYTGLSSSAGQQIMNKAINERYGLNLSLDWITGRSSEILPRLFAERRAGIYMADVTFTGNTTSVNVLKPAGVLDRLEPNLLLPEVLDSKAWFENKLPFLDKDNLILAQAASPTPPLSININLVKEGEIKSYNDLLNPRWKGKIIMDDPTIGGAANAWFAATHGNILSTDFMRQLARMDITILRNKRIEVEWLAQGKFPIGLGLEPTGVGEFMKAGAPLKLITPVEGTHLTSSSSNLALFTKAPHPNAARVFINWMLTREGQTLYSEATGYHSARIDVSTANLDHNRIRREGVKYLNTISEDYLKQTPEQTRIAREIFGHLIK